MSRRKYNVIVAPEALAMLSEHVGFLANVSVKAAKQFQTDCFKNIKSLEEMPYRCPSFDKVNLPCQKYRYLLFSNYALVFVIDEENGNIYVDYILDTRKDYGWLFHEN